MDSPDDGNSTVAEDSQKRRVSTPISSVNPTQSKGEEEKVLGRGSSWSPEPFSRNLWQRGDQALTRAWRAYLKALMPVLILITIVIFGMFAIFWGAIWKVPDHPLSGWIVDFDGGEVGHAVVEGLTSANLSFISWTTIPSSQFSEGTPNLVEAIKDEQAWVIVAISEGATARLQESISNPNPSYNGATAITALAAEARNENAYLTFLIQGVQDSLDVITLKFATQLGSQLSSNTNLASLLSISPQTVVNPISYTVNNVLPFSQPVATPATFVGLIFLLIVSFFVVTFSNVARMTSGIGGLLNLRSLIALRLLTTFTAYFVLSLWYSLLNLAFKLDVHHTFGKSGFVIFWMATWVYMLGVGLALDSLAVVLKQFVLFFLITWIIVNASINLYPLEVLPRVFRYGYAAPFYNYSKIVRTVVFGTKNSLGLHFGVLIAWIAVSCTTLIVTQWHARRLEIRAKQLARRT